MSSLRHHGSLATMSWTTMKQIIGLGAPLQGNKNVYVHTLPRFARSVFFFVYILPHCTIMAWHFDRHTTVMLGGRCVFQQRWFSEAWYVAVSVSIFGKTPWWRHHKRITFCTFSINWPGISTVKTLTTVHLFFEQEFSNVRLPWTFLYIRFWAPQKFYIPFFRGRVAVSLMG